MKLSIVATLYFSSKYIEEFCHRIDKVASTLVGDSYEIILINDGSPDNSLEVAIQLTSQNNHLVVVDLSRNFGHHKAMMTGLSYANGELVFLIDSDLEEEPEWLLEFNTQLEKTSSDVVYGVQSKRKGDWFERVSGNLFYQLLIKITGMSIPKNMVTARLMKKKYVEALLTHREREVFLAGLFHLTGYTQIPIEVGKHNTSKTTYSFKRKIDLLINSVTSFSAYPLILIFNIGMLIFIFTGIYAGSLIVRWLFYSNSVSGWTSVMVSIWLLGGLIISFIGIIGIYLSKIFMETKQRPYTLVKNVYSSKIN